MLEKLNLQELNQKLEPTQNLNESCFMFLNIIGQGSFGKVYRVIQNTTKKEFAIKVLQKEQIINLELTTQFQREMEILRMCKHKNIIQMFGAFEDNEYVFIVFEMASGGNLYQLMKRKGKFTEQEVKRIMNDVIQAVSYLHQQKPSILHRDLKPENILICNNNLKIADFGWSGIHNRLRNTYCGTPDYLSPEMILGTGHNEKLDVWSIGILTYELLHGKTPFRPSLKQQYDPRKIQRQLEGNVLKGKFEFDQNISIEAQEAIKAMLNPQPYKRPNSNNLLNFAFFSNKNTIQNNDSELQEKLIKIEIELEKNIKKNEILTKLIHEKDQKIIQQQIQLDTNQRQISKNQEQINNLQNQAKRNRVYNLEYSMNKQGNFQTELLNSKIQEINKNMMCFLNKNFVEQQYTYKERNEFENVIYKMKEIFENYSNQRTTLKRMLSSDYTTKTKFHQSLEINRKDDQNSYHFKKTLPKLEFTPQKQSQDVYCYTERKAPSKSYFRNEYQLIFYLIQILFVKLFNLQTFKFFQTFLKVFISRN